MTETLVTEYGNATLNRDGYFQISSVDLLKLKQKVLEKGLEWFIVNETIAKQVCDKYGYDLKEVD